MTKQDYRLYKIVVLSLLVLVVGFKDFTCNNSIDNKMTVEQLKEEEKNIIKEEL